MEKRKVIQFFRDAFIIACGVFFAALILGKHHIQYANFLSLFVVAIFISLLNAFLRPLFLTILMPLLMSFAGLVIARTASRSLLLSLAGFVIAAVFGLWIINAFIFSLASLFAGGTFVVHGFGSAMLGSVFTSAATLLICTFFDIKRPSVLGDILRRPMSDDTPPPQNSPRERKQSDDDVIDI